MSPAGPRRLSRPGSAAAWEREAERWVRFARTPGHDAYWFYRGAFFDEIVPEPGPSTLEIGCGEGRVARDLAGRGHRVVGVDRSATLIRFAAAADPSGRYAVADAAALPFPEATFDLAVAYNSLMDVDDLQAAVAEAARVLVPGGRLCVCVSHPLADAGRFEGLEREAPFTIPGTYYGPRPIAKPEAAGEGELQRTGWCYAIEDYARALEGAGLVIERLREPAASSRAVAARESFQRWERMPMFLHLRCRKAPPSRYP